MDIYGIYSYLDQFVFSFVFQNLIAFRYPFIYKTIAFSKIKSFLLPLHLKTIAFFTNLIA